MSLKPQSATKVLLPIRPAYAIEIFNGNKNFEYRRVIFRKPKVTTVVVYASAPTSKVIGEFKVLGIHECSPDALWQRTSDASVCQKSSSEHTSKARPAHMLLKLESDYFTRNRRRLKRNTASALPNHSCMCSRIIGFS